jgi:hypothetical protein
MISSKYLVAYSQSKSYSATNMHAKLVIRFRHKTPAYPSVTIWLRRLHFGQDILEPGIHSRNPSDGLVDVNILKELTARVTYHQTSVFSAVWRFTWLVRIRRIKQTFSRHKRSAGEDSEGKIGGSFYEVNHKSEIGHWDQWKLCSIVKSVVKQISFVCFCLALAPLRPNTIIQ